MKFKRVYIEISNICNLHCPFCIPLKREPRSMTIDEFTHVVSEVGEHTPLVYFHVKGEPLMHPLLPDFLDITAKNGLKVNLTTNGTLLKARSELLLSKPAVRQVNVSLHAFENGDYLADAVEFAKKADKQGIYVVLRLWNLDENGGVSKGSHEMMRVIESEFNVGESLAERMRVQKSVKLSNNVFIGWEREFVWPSMENEFISDDGFCYGMRYQIAVLADGTVVPCCLDSNGEAPLGNIFTESFDDILETKTAKAIKHGFERRQAVHPLCKRCDFRTKFDAERTR